MKKNKIILIYVQNGIIVLPVYLYCHYKVSCSRYFKGLTASIFMLIFLEHYTNIIKEERIFQLHSNKRRYATYEGGKEKYSQYALSIIKHQSIIVVYDHAS